MIGFPVMTLYGFSCKVYCPTYCKELIVFSSSVMSIKQCVSLWVFTLFRVAVVVVFSQSAHPVSLISVMMLFAVDVGIIVAVMSGL